MLRRFNQPVWKESDREYLDRIYGRTKATVVSTPHRHADIICAWVKGASIQGQSPSTDEWIDVPDVADLKGQYLEPNPLHPEYSYWDNWRIKP